MIDRCLVLCAQRHANAFFLRMTLSPTLKVQSDVRHIDALPVGTRLSEFEILALLGVGGFGMVYRAFDHSLHRTVAIKEYMPSTLVARANDGALWVRSTTDDPAFQAGLHSFVDEARMLAQFDHPSLVKVFRFWEEKNTAYMVMPLNHGMTLKQARMHMRTPPPEAWLRKLLWSVLSALRMLHDANMLHRDISPENIFLQDIGPPVLLDLGASRYAINDRDTKHTVVLKVNYAPIEQYSDGAGVGTVPLKQGPWSDLYSLGALVHGCLCNDAPLPATLRALRDRLVPFERVANTVETQFGEAYSDSFVNAISHALRLQPEDRPQSIDAFLALLHMSVPPAGMEHFDFRVELGAVWQEPNGQRAAALRGVANVEGERQTPAVRTSLEDAAALAAGFAPTLIIKNAEAREHEDYSDNGPATVFLEDEQRATQGARVQSVSAVASLVTTAVAHKQKSPKANSSEGKTLLSAPPRRAAPAANQTRRRKLWLMAGAAALIVAGAAAIGLRQTATHKPVLASIPAEAPALGSDGILTELKVPANDVTAAVSNSSDAQSLVGAPEVDAAVEPAPAFVLADDPRAAPIALRPKPKKKTAPEPEPVPESVVVIAPTPAPLPPRPVPVPVPVQAPVRVEPPRALCADSNVLTRSSCLRAECRNPDNRSNPACVEYRKAMEPLERNQFAN